jgi:hypothetical protein
MCKPSQFDHRKHGLLLSLLSLLSLYFTWHTRTFRIRPRGVHSSMPGRRFLQRTTFKVIQGTFRMIQGTFRMIQGVVDRFEVFDHL